MQTPEETLKLQTKRSEWAGTAKVAVGVAVAAAVFCVVGLALVAAGKEKSVWSALTPLSLVTIALILRSHARKQAGAIDSQLGLTETPNAGRSAAP
ncbi:MAG TPA: hypothetical protein VG734_15505 [Lacunisphaera sp.]|nr:hypothetical protein [Lacunisphaera sp.]